MFWNRKKDEVAELLYKVLVADAARGYAKQVAARMKIPYPTLSKYWLGKRRFPALLVRPLYEATDRDPRIAEFFLGGQPPPPDPIDLPRAVMLLGSLEAKVAELYLGATAPDGEAGERITAREAEALRTAVQRLITHAERVRAALEPGVIASRT